MTIIPHIMHVYLDLNCLWITPWIDSPNWRSANVPLLNILDLYEFSNIFVFVQGCLWGGLEPWMLTASISINAVLLSSSLSSAPPSLFLVWRFPDTADKADTTNQLLTQQALPFRLDSWLAAALQRVITVWFDRRQGVGPNQTEKRS